MVVATVQNTDIRYPLRKTVRKDPLVAVFRQPFYENRWFSVLKPFSIGERPFTGRAVRPGECWSYAEHYSIHVLTLAETRRMSIGQTVQLVCSLCDDLGTRSDQTWRTRWSRNRLLSTQSDQNSLRLRSTSPPDYEDRNLTLFTFSLFSFCVWSKYSDSLYSWKDRCDGWRFIDRMW